MDYCLFFWEVALVFHMLLYKNSEGLLTCNGHVWTEPAPVVQMGSNISIFCTSTKYTHCSQRAFVFFLNNEMYKGPLHCINDTTVQLQLHDVEIPIYTIICKVKPNGSNRELVCGMTISSGYPPDSPTNLTCVILENSFYMTCTWNRGKNTHIKTNYTVHLRSLQTNEEQLFLVKNNITIIAINELQDYTQYIVWIEAQNALGMATSDLLQFQLHEIVIPIAPIITKVESIDNSTSHPLIRWEKKTSIQNVHCEIRYKAAQLPTWSVIKGSEMLSINPLQLRNSLEPYTEYEFQAHCGQKSGKKYWSEWSASFKHTTPELAPSGMLDVWRFLGLTYTNGSHEVTVLIKPLSPEVARGIISKYEIFYEDHGYKTISKFCKTSELQCRIVVSQTVHTINVIAHNSQGTSKPAKLPVQLDYNRNDSLLPPRNMRVISAAQNEILITWESLEKFILWFILEWISTACENQEGNFSWKKVPKNQTSIYIQEFIEPRECIRISLYAIYSNGISKPCTEPIKGPDIILQQVVGDKVYIEWEDIPVCTQRGFITNYTIYLRNNNDFYSKYVVNVSKKQWIFENLSPGIDYAVYITASTAAGEGPQGTIRVITLDRDGSDTTVLVGVVLIAPMLIFLFVLVSNERICKRIKIILLSWMPTWFFEDFPNMKNSTAITSLKARNECIPLRFIPPVSYDEDPVIMEVQEIVVQEEHNSRDTAKDHQSLDNSENTLFVDTPSADLPAQASGYKPQISAIKNVAPFSDRTPHSISDAAEIMQSLENLWLKSDTSPLPSLWSYECGNNLCSFSERELTDPLSLTRAENYVPLEHKWGKQVSGDTVEEQTLLPDEMVVCLTSVNEESLDTKSYVTQGNWNLYQQETISVK
uniref:Interleukin-23 receptor-like isoform X3 n=1 Tax=Geotrypetes seraphini TaxID=260995 RepID=A0A6P8PBN0_GEOSA|nr:interleukin-23 receptor-like isoform X3 [Geotrypetes seraphini]